MGFLSLISFLGRFRRIATFVSAFRGNPGTAASQATGERAPMGSKRGHLGVPTLTTADGASAVDRQVSRKMGM